MALSSIFKKLQRKVENKLNITPKTVSETSKVRHMVLPYCVGEGCDVGFGRDKVKKEHCLGIDYAKPYARTGTDNVDIPCDIANEEINLPDNTLDYVYSSHLIEDFKDTAAILRKMIRILKDGGNLILVFPDQPRYAEHCIATGQTINAHHYYQDMGLEFMRNVLDEMPEVQYKSLFESNCDVDYNVVMVLQIRKS